MNELLTQLTGDQGVVVIGAAGGALFAISKAAEIIAKLIPDSAVGFLGGLRKVCKVLGLYIVNAK